MFIIGNGPSTSAHRRQARHLATSSPALFSLCASGDHLLSATQARPLTAPCLHCVAAPVSPMLPHDYVGSSRPPLIGSRPLRMAVTPPPPAWGGLPPLAPLPSPPRAEPELTPLTPPLHMMDPRYLMDKLLCPHLPPHSAERRSPTPPRAATHASWCSDNDHVACLLELRHVTAARGVCATASVRCYFD